jgi:precorrin-6B methylase 1
VYQIGPDLLYDKSMRDALSDQDNLSGVVLFSPQNFRPQDLPDDLDEVRLTDAELIHFGKLATTIKRFYDQLVTDLSAFDDNYEEEKE